MADAAAPADRLAALTRARVLLRDLRGRLRASEAWFIVLAIGLGAAAGLLSVIQGSIARLLQN
ncbi:MAG TPA: hypothetical protein PLO65_14310, partial [Caulobacter sp.]|nr:hypothetical protein [Caulobacter sp.]